MQALDTPALRSRVEDFQLRHNTRVVTMLFSDVVGSTRLKSMLGDKEGIRVLLRHHEVFRQTLATLPDAEEIGTAGDSFFLAFAKPSDAVRFALRAQKNVRALAAETGREALDRIGIHVGEVWVDHTETPSRTMDLYGTQVDLCARVSSLADADQILLTRFAFDSARQVLTREEVKDFETLSWLNHGPYLMKGIDEPIEVCEVGEIGAARLTAPADSEKVTRYISSDAEPVLGWRPAVGQPVPETSWILDEKLGEGGFGEVWRGHDKVLKTPHVFKFCFRAERARSLKREATIFRLLKERIGHHPNIVGIENVYFDHPPFYIVMQHVDGHDLAAWLSAEGKENVSVETRLRLVAQVADAVQAAHDTGIVHRDIKPSNILVSGSGERAHAYLTDFGIGNITSETTLAGITQFGFTQTVTRQIGIGGTQLYMAPELLVDQAPSVRSDIYSLGVVLYQALVGDFSSPVTSDWPGEIDDPLLREDLQLCFAKDPLKRFAGAGELAARLRSLSLRRVEREEALARHRADEERATNERVAKENARYSRRILWAALFEAPMIGTLLGWTLYFTDDESGRYDFASGFHIGNYIFFLCLTAMYFGLDTGMRTYFRDATTGFVSAQGSLWRYLLRLCAMTAGIVALQTFLVVQVGNAILQVRGMNWDYRIFTFLVGFCGAAMGFFFASLVKNRENGVRILFGLIMLQVIFGGALIKFDEMNRDLDLISRFKLWTTRHPEATNGGRRDDSALHIPMPAHFLPVMYGYEALVVAQVDENPLTSRQHRLQAQIDDLIARRALTSDESARLEDLKDTMAILSGMEARSARAIEDRLKLVDKVIEGQPLAATGLVGSGVGVSAERLFVNQKLAFLVSRSVTTQDDLRQPTAINAFFSPEKRFDFTLFGHYRMVRMSTLTYDGLCLVAGSVFALFLFSWSLRLRVAPFNARWAPRYSAALARVTPRFLRQWRGRAPS